MRTTQTAYLLKHADGTLDIICKFTDVLSCAFSFVNQFHEHDSITVELDKTPLTPSRA